MGNDPSRPLLDIIGDYDCAKWSEQQPWQVMYLAEPSVVSKILAFQRHSLTAMNNGTSPVDGVDETKPQPRDALDMPRAKARVASLWRLNRLHSSITGDKGAANVAAWTATACSRDRSKWMVPTYLPREQDVLSLPSRNCHVVRFYRGEPYEAMQKCTVEDPSLNCSDVDVYLSSAGLYAPLLWYDSRACDRARMNRSAIVPPAPPALGSMATDELLLGLVDVCLGLCYLHAEHPLSSASGCSHNNLSWSALYVRTDALGSRLPWVIGDPRFSRLAAHGAKPLLNTAGAFNRSAKERDFTAPEVVRSEEQVRGAFASGDLYSFGRLVESVLPPSSTARDDPVVAAARRELEKFVSACQQGDAASRPNVEQFLALPCVQHCAFARMMRILDFFFPWAPESAAAVLSDGSLQAAEETAAAPALEHETEHHHHHHHHEDDEPDDDDEEEKEEHAAAAKIDQLDSEDDIAAFALDVAFGVSPRQLPASVLVRVKALFFATLHIECLKIPSELFMRRVVPRVLDHTVFCSGAASPFLWQLLTPIRSNLAADQNDNPLMMIAHHSSSSSSSDAHGPAAIQVTQLPVCGLLHANDLRNIFLAFVEAGGALPFFVLEKGPATLNVMFARPDNGRLAAAISQTQRKHKALLFLRGVDLVLAQISPELLATMVVPFVAACLASPHEFILRAALSALKSIVKVVIEQKLSMQDRNPNIFSSSSSSSSGGRGAASDEVADEEEEEDDDESDVESGAKKSSSSSSSKVDPRWYFAILITLRSLIKVSQISLNETAQHDTQLRCFNLSVEAASIGFSEMQPKLVAVSQRIVASTSPTAYSPVLKIAALEFLYRGIQALRQQQQSSSSVFDETFIAEVLPCCLTASQCASNSAPVRSLSTKMLCIMLSLSEQQSSSSSIGVTPSLRVLSDRWDAASSGGSSPSLLGVEVKPLGSTFPSHQQQKQDHTLGVYTARSVRNGIQIKLFARTERHGSAAAATRKMAVMIPADFSHAALAPSRPASGSAISWLSHDADHKLNAAHVLNAAQVARFFSEREGGEVTPLRGHPLCLHLPTRRAEMLLDQQQQAAAAAAASSLSPIVSSAAAGKGAAAGGLILAGGGKSRRARQRELQKEQEAAVTKVEEKLDASTGGGLSKRRAVAAAAAEAIPEPAPPVEKPVQPQHQPQPEQQQQKQESPPVIETQAVEQQHRDPEPGHDHNDEQQQQQQQQPEEAQDAPASNASFATKSRPSANAVPRRRRAPTHTGDAPAAVPAAMLDAVMDDL